MVRLSGNRFRLYWDTLKWLKPEQWAYRFKDAIFSQYYKRFPAGAQRRLSQRVPQRIVVQAATSGVSWFHKTYDGAHGMFLAEDILNGRFTFLNQSKCFDGPPQWKNPELTYLWDFNLHYFEYLEPLAARNDVASKNAIRSLLSNWIDANPCPLQPAWHPYPISLRTIHWVKLLVNYPELSSDAVLRSLYAQFLFLERNLEGRLQVNHLLENGRALTFGGLFFEGKDAQRWLKVGLRILKREIREEYLPCGGHFERSPMYHCILLEALLDTHAFLARAGREAGWLEGALLEMCAWLEAIRCPDGTFPLFNDAAIGISAAPDEILANAARMIGFRPKTQLDAVRDCDQFFALDMEPFFCVVDGAPIGPDYNPGHAHSDNFTFELFFYGQRLVVDAGVFGYDVTPERIASRSTRAHNTVVVNGLEQSEAWGGFRVARRSNPLFSRADKQGDCLVFRGKYANQVDRKQGITHERVIVVSPARWVLAWDLIEARGAITAESLCRLGPGWIAHEAGKGYALTLNGHESIYVYPIQAERSVIQESSYAPEFGKSLSVAQFLWVTSGEKTVEMGYLFTTQALSPEAAIRVQRGRNGLDIEICGAKTHIDWGTQ